MRHLLLAIFTALLVFPVASSAQTQDPEAVKLALAYHERCLYNAYTERSIPAREDFCRCTAEKALGVLSRGQLQTMATGEGDPIDEKTLAIEIEAPCLGPVISNYEYEQCYYDKRFQHIFASLQGFTAMCSCVGDGMAAFLNEYSKLLMEVTLEKITGPKKPLDKLMMTSDYRREKSQVRSECMSHYARR